MADHLFLIPGYLGFRGKEGYWGFWDAVIPLLTAQDFVCHPVPTEPIGKIQRRARKLLDTILRVTRDGETLGASDRIHLLGFSTGGLDARYLLSTVSEWEIPPTIRARIRTVATLATPHRGTPLADFYRSWKADDWLGFFAGISAKWTTTERLAELGRLAQKHRATLEKLLPPPRKEEFLRLVEGLLTATDEERAGIPGFLQSLSRSRGALDQLRVRRMRTFNRLVHDAPDTRYLSYATGATPIRPTNFGTALYALGCFIVSRWPIPEPPLPDEGRIPLEKVCALDGKPLPPDAPPLTLPPKLSDGVVPTCSQFWGEFRAYAPIDHHAAYGRPLDLMRVPEFAGDGVKAFYERIGADLRS